MTFTFNELREDVESFIPIIEMNIGFICILSKIFGIWVFSKKNFYYNA